MWKTIKFPPLFGVFLGLGKNENCKTYEHIFQRNSVLRRGGDKASEGHDDVEICEFCGKLEALSFLWDCF